MTAGIRAGHTIFLQWIPGHGVLTGNKAADSVVINAYHDGQKKYVRVYIGDTG